jgi:hypothetical protein
MPILSNAKHEAFVQAVASGQPATTAYANAGYKSDNIRSVEAASSALLKNNKVATRLLELRQQTARKAKFTRDRLAAFYEDIVETPKERTSDRLKAGDQLSKLLGWDAPEQKLNMNMNLLVDSATLARIQATYSDQLIPLLNPEVKQITEE